jgi:serine/threonine protein kinase
MDEKEKRELIADIIYKRLTGDPNFAELSDTELVGRFPELGPELGEKLAAIDMRAVDSQLRETERFPGNDSAAHDVEDPQSVRPGTVLMDRFLIIRSVGQGGMGSVYLASDLARKRRLVALKFLRNRPDIPQTILQDEVDAALKITDRHVCRLYDLHRDGDTSFVTMEFIDGQSLAALLTYLGRFPADRVRQIAVECCLALHAAHQQGVIHRDIKPANIMIDKDGQVRLMDFGLATVASDQRVSGPVGTIRYMAPEQKAGRATHASDIYSLGVVLYELCTGRHPFQSRPRDATANAAPIPAANYSPDIDRSLDRMISLCLSASPESRPATAYAMLQMLGSEHLVSPPDAIDTDIDERMPREHQQAICLFALVIVGLFTGAWMSGDFRLVEHAGFTTAPNVLQSDAQKIVNDRALGLQSLGVSTPFEAIGYQYDTDFRNTPAYAQQGISFWYRRSPKPLAPTSFSIGRDNSDARVSYKDPFFLEDGMIGIRMRPHGALIEFRAVVRSRPKDNATLDTPPEWDDKFKKLFEQAKLDFFSRRQIERDAKPPDPWDTDKVWECPSDAGVPMRVEGATLGDHITWFSVTSRDHPNEERENIFRSISSVLDAVLYLSLMAAAMFVFAGQRLIRRRLGKSDRLASGRAAMIIGALCLVSWAFTADHTFDLEDEVRSLRLALANALLWAGTTWMLYGALEPILRFRSGVQLNSWNNLIHGWLHPLVGRDILLGCVAGALSIPILGWLNVGTRQLFDLDKCFSIPYPPTLAPLVDGHTIYGRICDALVNGVYTGFVLLLFPIAVEQLARLVLSNVPFLLPERLDLRKVSLFVVWLIITTFLYYYYGEPSSTSYVWFLYMGLWVAMFLFVTHRIGLLASIVMVASLEILVVSPVTIDTKRWYFTTGLTGMVAVALFAFVGAAIVIAVPRLDKNARAAIHTG